MTAALLEQWAAGSPSGAPESAVTVAPPTIEAIARVLEWASLNNRDVLPWGGGTHMGPRRGAEPAVIVMTTALNQIVDWQPDDLTLVVEAGALVDDVEALLAERNQSAMLDESSNGSTIGGAIAAGISGYRRLYYGPTRDRMLQAQLATGDGRVVTAGGRVVKNVTGYDIPRLVCGSLGALGVIGQVCLKLWPVPEGLATLAVDGAAALNLLYRPLAFLETESGFTAYVAGTPEEIAAQAAAVGAVPTPGLAWPASLTESNQLEVRVPAPLVDAAVDQVRAADATALRAQHGVGIVAAGFADWSLPRLEGLRAWAERHGGAAVVVQATQTDVDRWGTPPGSVDLQRRVKAAFDPLGIMVPGRLPGGV